MENKVEKQNVSNMKQELIKKEYQDNLTSYLDSKLDEVIEKLQKSNKNLSTIELRSLLAQKNTIGVSPKYNNTELAILFDYYQL